jgi:integrase
MAFRMARPIIDPKSKIGIYKVRTDSAVLVTAKGRIIGIPVGDSIRNVKIGAFVQVSLGTSDAKEIKERHATADAAVRKFFDELGQSPEPLSPLEIASIQAELRNSLLHGGQLVSLKPTPGDPSPTLVGRILAAKRRVTTPESEQELEAVLQATMRDVNLAEQRRRAGDYQSDAKPIEGLDWVDQQHQRERSGKSLQVSHKPGDQLTLMALFEKWRKARQPSEETAVQWKKMTERFNAFLGHDDARMVTKQDIERWRDDLRDKGIGAKRIKEGYIASLKAMFGFASAEGVLPDNVARDVKVVAPRTAQSRSKGFTDEEAAMILGAATASSTGGRQAPDTIAARRWVPWLCAYTGARVAEITQLRKEDLIQERGVVGLRITPDAGSTKTGRFRDVPLHPHLIEQGFVTFVQRQKKGPLFYNADRAIKKKHRAHKTRAEGMAEWVRSIGLTDMRVDPNHGWRHRFKTEARRCQMASDVRDYVQGHAPRTEGENYGDMPLDVTFNEIRKLASYKV